MATMKVSAQDTECPTCIGSTTVELNGTSSVTIIVHVKLHGSFPQSGETLTGATFKYEVGANNKTEPLDYSEWEAGGAYDIELEAESWLTDQDFENMTAKMEVITIERTVKQEWTGVEE